MVIDSIQWIQKPFCCYFLFWQSYPRSIFTIQVYTLENENPLFIFEFEDRILRQAMFVTSNGVDYLVWFTNESIKIFDLSLNAYSKVIDIQEYDSEIQQICVLLKADKD